MFELDQVVGVGGAFDLVVGARLRGDGALAAGVGAALAPLEEEDGDVAGISATHTDRPRYLRRCGLRPLMISERGPVHRQWPR